MQRRAFLQSTLFSPLWAAAWKQGPPSEFKAEILEMMGVAPVPGAVIGTVHDGKPGWVCPLGVRNIETKDPVLPDTIFQAASLSKQATCYAAFALRSQGKLDFDKPLVSYVDDLPDPQARKVTPRHVLSHTTGFPNWRSESGQELVPEFPPGSKFQYSGEGFFYLQRVLEEVSGVGFGELMQNLVFKPLQMNSTSMVWRPEWAARYAQPHGRRGELFRNWDLSRKRLHPLETWRYADSVAAAKAIGQSTLPNSLIPNAAATMTTTAPDYARFLSAAMVNPEIGKEQIRFRPTLGWGLGWGIEHSAGRVNLWQWGDNPGFKNFVLADPSVGHAVFVFTNGDSGARVYDRVVTHRTGRDHPALFWV